jgi:hypothetical protein
MYYSLVVVCDNETFTSKSMYLAGARSMKSIALEVAHDLADGGASVFESLDGRLLVIPYAQIKYVEVHKAYA